MQNSEKILYLECGTGISGDMTVAALIDLGADQEKLLRVLEGIPAAGFKTCISRVKKAGIECCDFDVILDEEHAGHDHDMAYLYGHLEEESLSAHEHDHHHDHDHEHEHDHHDHHHHDHDHHHHDDHDHHHHDDHDHHHDHHHASMADVENIINSLKVSDRVKSDVINVYKLIADAESKAHDAPVSEIHFHEVGTMDAIADVTMVCSLMEKLDLDCVMASPVHVGSGHVHCAHGILPVPAPATAYILKNVPIYGGEIKGELCTPTGAALLKYFVDSFGDMPAITIEKYGYGMGNKDFEMANCVRVMLGEAKEKGSEIIELSCNLDDITSEKLAFAMDMLFEAGALEVYTIPVGMKKSRPGVLLCVMCNQDKKREMLDIIFKHTTTLGVRENVYRRYTMDRNVKIVSSSFGDVRVKYSKGYGVERRKFEYDDLAKIAKETGKTIKEIEHEIAKEIQE